MRRTWFDISALAIGLDLHGGGLCKRGGRSWLNWQTLFRVPPQLHPYVDCAGLLIVRNDYPRCNPLFLNWLHNLSLFG